MLGDFNRYDNCILTGLTWKIRPQNEEESSANHSAGFPQPLNSQTAHILNGCQQCATHPIVYAIVMQRAKFMHRCGRKYNIDFRIRKTLTKYEN